MPEELWTEVRDIIPEAEIKTIPKKKMCKMVAEESLQTAVKRRETKGKGEKERLYPFECRVPKNSKER